MPVLRFQLIVTQLGAGSLYKYDFATTALHHEGEGQELTSGTTPPPLFTFTTLENQSTIAVPAPSRDSRATIFAIVTMAGSQRRVDRGPYIFVAIIFQVFFTTTLPFLRSWRVARIQHTILCFDAGRRFASCIRLTSLSAFFHHVLSPCKFQRWRRVQRFWLLGQR